MSADNHKTIGLRERKKAKTMAAVQMHALRLFKEFGYYETTVEQIAEAAEISPSTFFRYFATKEDVVTTDNYDPLLISAFEDQPTDLNPLQAIRNAMKSAMAQMSDDEFTTMNERNQLIMTVPALRAASLNNMAQTMEMLAKIIAERMDHTQDDLAIRTLAGAVMGVNMSVMLYYAEHPEADFAKLLDESLTLLEKGLPL
ncbi:TetR family transcriptional regulator [Paenibacillus sp. D2_2]|uniref:acyl-CoA-like ligand-binding transcription factor n=1 Tax=Paenibacillus sp. D2_2 TaxID=3073092 RepID=UPI0028149AF2|nr:TetR family transcriptional regulator [Paenibacillus sp. D2_2]WMT39849.1 TetR family transcriptional regulator [Paenibacillus sp. D2_2]